ncbi:MAG: DUF308 domain-containing protein [Lachnospiraceae bacterium]|nr:DUF308 domain-containing protein [Lachnospiraceae bacterium]
MKVIKEIRWNVMLKGILYIILGIIALALPETMEKTIGYLLGVVLIIAGGISIISYLLRDVRENYYRDDFVFGLVEIVIGIIVLLKVEIIISLIPILFGILVIISGCTKLQDAVDMKRMNYAGWIAMLILALINIVLGLVLIFNPFAAVELMFRVIGIGLIFSGITDCAAALYFARRMRRYDTEAVESSYEEVTEEEKE